MNSDPRTFEALKHCDRLEPMVTRHDLFIGTALCERLPPAMLAPLVRYLAYGDPMGGFLTALVSGELFDAGCNADANNNPRLADFAIWIAQTWPQESFGSALKMKRWRERGGLADG
jgi:hypothetical protein